MLTRVIVWLRNDLRLKDNYVFEYAMKLKGAQNGKEVVPVFCFDPRIYSKKMS